VAMAGALGVLWRVQGAGGAMTSKALGGTV
jgi:hypothetical protein